MLVGRVISAVFRRVWYLLSIQCGKLCCRLSVATVTAIQKQQHSLPHNHRVCFPPALLEDLPSTPAVNASSQRCADCSVL